MKTVKRPTITARLAYLTCISKEGGEFLTRLNACIPDILNAAQDFENKAQNTQLHLIPKAKMVGQVTVGEMKSIYTTRMAAKGAPGRAIYDLLKLATPNDTCPLCNSRGIKNLDHHLAKAKHPALAVAPLNLVPACFDCNKIKTATNPANASEETLHPYFDNIEGQTWLSAEVVETSPPTVIFSIIPPAGANVILSSRVQHHFKIFKLNDLYVSNAGRTMAGFKNVLINLYAAGGRNATRSFLDESAKSFRLIDKNSWETAMFQALSENEWYYDGGFN